MKMKNRMDIKCEKNSEIAITIIRNELLRHGELYDGFLSSIESSIIEQGPSLSYRNPHWIAKEILSRIIGDD